MSQSLGECDDYSIKFSGLNYTRASVLVLETKQHKQNVLTRDKGRPRNIQEFKY